MSSTPPATMSNSSPPSTLSSANDAATSGNSTNGGGFSSRQRSTSLRFLSKLTPGGSGGGSSSSTTTLSSISGRRGGEARDRSVSAASMSSKNGKSPQASISNAGGDSSILSSDGGAIVNGSSMGGAGSSPATPTSSSARSRSVSGGGTPNGDSRHGNGNGGLQGRKLSIGGKARRRISLILHPGGKDKDKERHSGRRQGSMTPPPPSQSSAAEVPPVPVIPVEHKTTTTPPAAALTDEPEAMARSDEAVPVTTAASPPLANGVAQLNLDNDPDSDSDSDSEQFYTPTDGLSEVAEEEEDEEDGLVVGADDTSVHRAQVSASPSVLASHINHRARHGVAPIDQSSFLRDDISVCAQAVALFLTSRMREAETLIYESDPEAQHMYVQNAGAVIQAIKGMMTFDQEDLSVALEIAKGTSALADSLRKPGGGIGSKLAGLVRSNGVENIRSMTLVQKHAELVYAESLLLKAVLGIVAGGSWVGLINEALNMRSAYGIYRTLQQYLEASGGEDEMDEDFKSGVELGTGLSSLMLSLLPGKVLKVAEIFGYTGDRRVALATLMSAGGWSETSVEPGISAENDGVRRPICDMALLTFHLAISALIPVSGVSVPLAKNILEYNLRRFPNGIFFLYFQSRLYTTQGQPEKANATLQSALDLPLEYLQLQHICLFDMAVNSLMMCNIRRARSCFKILAAESSWSKATYIYSEAACLAELDDDHERLEQLMADVPKNTRRLAGKSLPIEKFVSRKARKFASQKRLLLPALELGYFFGALPNAPPRMLYNKVIPRIRSKLDVIIAASPDHYEGYWDDYCLAHFLLGVCLSFAAYPHTEAVISEHDTASYPMSVQEAEQEAKSALEKTLEGGSHIQLDHWIVYHAHYELARLVSQQGDNASCRRHLDAIMSGKPLEINPHVKREGKYSMESALMLKTNAALQSMKEEPGHKMH